ncbi:hypothetical protein [Aquimarina litoralis]|uniref:hypothetical protein n=1 Tax=Aquimarina litoralis TaxID=584605 RepID=UPI001C55FF9C|nr:hypothetical protein [Aquimarina litoralis]MBW1298333.1 hypothetical protein [Aquimarina litoralis]
MLKKIVAIGNTLSKKEQKTIQGGFLSEDPDGEIGEGGLCLRGGTQSNQKCAAGLTCKSNRPVGIGICERKQESISQF